MYLVAMQFLGQLHHIVGGVWVAVNHLTLYGPINLGISFLAQPFSSAKF